MSDEYVLLTGEANVGDGMIMTQRWWASGVLRDVADDTQHGAYPQEITAFDLGRALGRALTNSNESDDPVFIEAELFRGMLHYRDVKVYKPELVREEGELTDD